MIEHKLFLIREWYVAIQVRKALSSQGRFCPAMALGKAIQAELEAYERYFNFISPPPVLNQVTQEVDD